MVDLYLSCKKRKSRHSPFAFMRVGNKKEADHAIKNLNGLVLRGSAMEL